MREKGQVRGLGKWVGLGLWVGFSLGVSSFGCSKNSEASTQATGSSASPKKVSPTPNADGPAFRVDVGHASCSQGQACTSRLTLTAMAGYHLNKEYPYRFTVESKGECEFSTTTFGKENFQAQSETVGTMTMTCTAPKKAGTFPFTGTFKFSVCTDDKCLIESTGASVNVQGK